MKTTYKGRPIEIDGIHCERDETCCYVEAAHWLDNDRDLNIDELEALTDECGDLLYEAWQEYLIGEADALCDAARDNF